MLLSCPWHWPQEQRDTGSKAPARPAAAPLEAFWSTVVDGDLVRLAVCCALCWRSAVLRVCPVLLLLTAAYADAFTLPLATNPLNDSRQPGTQVASSHERKYLAFTLFQLLLPHLG